MTPSNNIDFKPIQQLNALHSVHLRVKTKAQSMQMGRRLYVYTGDQVALWLKTQLAVDHEHAAQLNAGFQHEIQCYRYFTENGAGFVLPYELLNNSTSEHSMWGDVVLQLPHAEPYFAQSASTLSHQQRVNMLWKVLNTVGQLHDLGCIHADFKTEHFVCNGQTVYLLDFEHVEFLEPCQNSDRFMRNQCTHMTATPRYMAPELFHGQAKSIQSDLYALGIILLQWLQGTRLMANSYQAWAVLHCQRLNLKLPTSTQAFQPLIDGLLAKHQTQRFNTIAAVKRCLMTEIE